jgi:hypothetical protein
MHSGWDISISLFEKPLHGLQDALPITIKEARKLSFADNPLINRVVVL